MKQDITSLIYKTGSAWNNAGARTNITDTMYLILLGICMVRYFFHTVMFVIEWPVDFYFYLHIALSAVVFFKYVANDHLDVKNTLLACAVFIVFIGAWMRTGYKDLFTIGALILGAHGINYKKIIKVYLLINIPLSIYTVFASQMGWVTNLIYDWGGRDRLRESFGFVYPTDFAAHIFFMIVAWVMLRQLKCTLLEIGTMLLLVIFLYIKCDTRNSEITITFIAIYVLALKYKNKLGDESHKGYQIGKVILRLGCLISPILFFPVMIFLCRFYNPDSLIMANLDRLLTRRLTFGKKTFDNYDTTLWGQVINMDGNGGSLIKPTDYTFIDCSYISILMRFGFFMFVLVFIFVEIIMLKNLENTCILGLLMVVCLHSVLEHHLFEFHYNIFIILPLAAFPYECVSSEKGIQALKKRLLS